MWRQIILAVAVAWAATQVAIRANQLWADGLDKLEFTGTTGRAQTLVLKNAAGPATVEEALKLVLFRSLPGAAGLAVALYWGASEAFANAGVAVSMFQAVPSVARWIGLLVLGYTLPLHLSTWVVARLLGFRWVALPVMVLMHGLNNLGANLTDILPALPADWRDPTELGLRLVAQVLPAALVLIVALRWTRTPRSTP